MKILVTGGSGMVGRCVRELFPDATYPTSSELDLTDGRAVEDYMSRTYFDFVIHLAAHVGSLHDNIENSTLYFDENVLMNTNLTKYAYKYGVKNFLGILSTCIYPDAVDEFPIAETELHNGVPHIDLMTYSYAKRSHAVQLDAYKKSFGVNFNYLIPCNLYGEKIEDTGRSHFLNDLIHKICIAKINGERSITLFGDGTPLRQFMHAEDFAQVIFDYVQNGVNASFNVAPEINLSIAEMAKIALEVCGCSDFDIRYDSSKPNGQLRKDVDSSLMRQHLPHTTFRALKDGLEGVYKYEYQRLRPAVQ